MPSDRPPSPWHEFFLDLAKLPPVPIQLHCLGGFVVSVLYGMPRPTADVDFLTVVPAAHSKLLRESAGEGSVLHRRHRVYLQQVTVASVPENYATRLVAMFPTAYGKIRLFGLEAHDLALSKLERNAGRDRDDVRYLREAGHIDPATLESRYRSELRSYLAAPERHDLTLRLWIEMLGE